MHIVLPTTKAEDWKRCLAKPSHWKAGHSAMALAQCWEATKRRGLPAEVRAILPQAEPLIAIPELQVDLPPKGGRPSQTDLFVLARETQGLVAITVEGKVEESFGPTLEERRLDRSAGVKMRIEFLLKTLGLPADVPGGIRYQLLHRTVAAILSAQRFAARRAVMLVHSFSSNATGYEDWSTFVRLLGAVPRKGIELAVGSREGVDLSLAWCSGPSKYLWKLAS
jgi:hypothetical protein